ncbi:MAG: hypothetical protein AB1486_18685 [Planctomycetota bacterium]
MKTVLSRLANGTTIVRFLRNRRRGTACLNKKIRCRVCWRWMRMNRFVNLRPRGVRAYYACTCGNLVAVDRDGATRFVADDGRRLWFR